MVNKTKQNKTIRALVLLIESSNCWVPINVFFVKILWTFTDYISRAAKLRIKQFLDGFAFELSVTLVVGVAPF